MTTIEPPDFEWSTKPLFLAATAVLSSDASSATTVGGELSSDKIPMSVRYLTNLDGDQRLPSSSNVLIPFCSALSRNIDGNRSLSPGLKVASDCFIVASDYFMDCFLVTALSSDSSSAPTAVLSVEVSWAAVLSSSATTAGGELSSVITFSSLRKLIKAGDRQPICV